MRGRRSPPDVLRAGMLASGAATAVLMAGLALAGLAASAARPGPADTSAGSAVVAAGRTELVVRSESGTLLASMALPDGGFALRYRNSVYRSLAEERFRVDGNAFHLIELAADERAVLDEYYEIAGPARRAGAADGRAWVGTPARPLRLAELAIAATDLGRRTVVVAGAVPLELWRLADDREPTVVISLRRPDE